MKEVFSASGDHFVRVIPGDSLGDAIGFAGSPKGTYAKAEYYRREPDRSYRLMQSVTLLNPIAPTDFFVSNDGQLVTIDNCHNIGYGSVLAVYDAHGQVVKAYTLEELFSAPEIAALGHSVSSRQWHQGPVYINQDQRTLYMMIESGRDLVVGLQTGRFAYCETQGGKFLCRDGGEERRWLPYTAAVPDR
jgi:hypothetical protein